MYDSDDCEEFARTGAVITYDLLFNLNENLEYVEAEFQIENNLHYARQRANGAFNNCFRSMLLIPEPFRRMGAWRMTMGH